MTLGVRAQTYIFWEDTVQSTHPSKNFQALTCFINHYYFWCLVRAYIAIKYQHKLSGLKQHRFIIFLFYRLEVQPIFHWAKIKGTATLLPASSRGELISLPFPVSGGHPHSLPLGPFVVHLQSQ